MRQGETCVGLEQSARWFLPSLVEPVVITWGVYMKPEEKEALDV